MSGVIVRDLLCLVAFQAAIGLIVSCSSTEVCRGACRKWAAGVQEMKGETFEDYQARMLHVLAHIQKNLDGSLSLEELAAVAHFSSFHFHRIFRGLVGESVKEHVRRLRLERAAHRLRHTGQQITEIALDAGYQTLESFTRAFHRMFSQSPSEFRARHGVVAYGHPPSGVHFVAEGA